MNNLKIQVATITYDFIEDTKKSEEKESNKIKISKFIVHVKLINNVKIDNLSLENVMIYQYIKNNEKKPLNLNIYNNREMNNKDPSMEFEFLSLSYIKYHIIIDFNPFEERNLIQNNTIQNNSSLSQNNLNKNPIIENFYVFFTIKGDNFEEKWVIHLFNPIALLFGLIPDSENFLNQIFEIICKINDLSNQDKSDDDQALNQFPNKILNIPDFFENNKFATFYLNLTEGDLKEPNHYLKNRIKFSINKAISEIITTKKITINGKNIVNKKIVYKDVYLSIKPLLFIDQYISDNVIKSFKNIKYEFIYFFKKILNRLFDNIGANSLFLEINKYYYIELNLENFFPNYIINNDYIRNLQIGKLNISLIDLKNDFSELFSNITNINSEISKYIPQDKQENTSNKSNNKNKLNFNLNTLVVIPPIILQSIFKEKNSDYKIVWDNYLYFKKINFNKFRLFFVDEDYYND